jgi:hypothetical protein
MWRMLFAHVKAGQTRLSFENVVSVEPTSWTGAKGTTT